MFGTTGSHVRDNQTPICWICDMGVEIFGWAWDVRGQKVWDVGGIFIGMCDVESPHNHTSARMIGGFDTYLFSGSIVSTHLVSLDFDAHSLWILVCAPFSYYIL